VQNPEVRAVVQRALSHLGDLERLAVRGTLGEATPRDLGNVRRGLQCAEEALTALFALPDKTARESLVGTEEFDLVADLRDMLAQALVERPPVQAKEGTVFVEGFDTKLDELQRLRHSGSERMTELEQELRLATQIPTLRVK